MSNPKMWNLWIQMADYLNVLPAQFKLRRTLLRDGGGLQQVWMHQEIHASACAKARVFDLGPQTLESP